MNHRPLSIITYLILVLTIISCWISTTHNEIYQDGEWANVQWLGQDLVTLFLATPILFIAQYQSTRKQNWKWKIVWSGILFYFVYTYAFFMFAARLTFLYLFHLPIFGLAVIGFVISLLDIFQLDFKISTNNNKIKWAIIIYHFLISLMIGGLWLNDIFSHLTNPNHQSDVPGGEAPLIIYSLDLAIVIPLMIVAAVGFYRKKQYGYKLTGIMLVKTGTLGFALMSMTFSMYFQQLTVDILLILLWLIIGLIGLMMGILFLWDLKNVEV